MKNDLKSGSVLVVLAVSFLSVFGCSRVEKFNVTETDKEIPYKSLGTLEVEAAVPRVTGLGAMWTSAEVMTLSLVDSPSRGDHYKYILNSKLGEKARRYYGADAVINVKYWPEPGSSSFPHGKVYARGEMIRYEKFPA